MTRFHRGFGRLDAATLNNLLRAESAVAREPGPGVGFRTRYYGPIVCKVNGHSALDANGNRWLYEVTEVQFDDDTTATPVVAGFAHLRVVNLAEFGNNATKESGLDIANLPGSFRLQPIPSGTLVDVFVAPTSDATNRLVAYFNRPGEFDGDCTASLTGGEGGGTTLVPVQAFTGTWTSNTQYGGTETIGTKHVIDLSIGAERWAANSIRLWNGPEALNAGATVSSTRNQFPTTADCRTWWNLWVVRVNVNGEGWQYLNATNAGNVTVGGSAQLAYLNTSPAVSWSGADFAAGLAMDVEVYELAAGGGP